MGEAAEMMLDGTVCEGCGEVFDDVIAGEEAPGYPRRCSACEPAISLQQALKQPLNSSPRARKAERHNRERHDAARNRKPFECHCGKCFRTEGGLKQHTKDVHASNEESARLIAAAPDLLKALQAVRQELWVDHCLHMGRTDIDPAPFNARPHIRIIDAAIAKATGGGQ